MSLKITLDPGHGKNANQSPAVPSYYEGNRMFVLAGFLEAELKKRGFEVLVTRDTITDNPSLSERGSMAGENGCSLFLSLHSNAPGQSTDADGNKYYDTSVTGTVVYYSMTRAENLELADLLGNKVAEIMGHYFRGSKTKQYPNKPGVDYYGVIRGAAQSGCSTALLIEHGFHTCPADAEFLLVDENLVKIAEAEADIIAGYFGTSSEEPAEEKPETSEIVAGSLVSIKAGATYWSGKTVPEWVSALRWYVYQINASTGRAVINADESGKHEIMSPVSADFLEVVSSGEPAEITPEPAEATPEPEATPETPTEEKTVENTIASDEELTLPVTFRKYGSILSIDFDREKLSEFIK